MTEATTTTPTLADDLIRLTRVLYRSRAELAIKQATRDLLERKLRESNGELYDSIADYKKHVAETEARVKALALRVHKQTAENEPAPGVKIRQRQTVEYDPDKVIPWATEKLPILVDTVVRLDAKNFEALVKKSPAICPLATVRVEPEATIAKDLSAYDVYKEQQP